MKKHNMKDLLPEINALNSQTGAIELMKKFIERFDECDCYYCNVLKPFAEHALFFANHNDVEGFTLWTQLLAARTQGLLQEYRREMAGRN